MFLRNALFTTCITLNTYSADLLDDLLKAENQQDAPPFAIATASKTVDLNDGSDLFADIGPKENNVTNDKINVLLVDDLLSKKPITTDKTDALLVDELLSKKPVAVEEKPLNFEDIVMIVKTQKLPEAFKDFTFADQEISENAHLLQDLQLSLEPISAWLKKNQGNFAMFFKEAGFSDTFIKQFCTEEYHKLICKVFTVMDFPADDAIYDEAMVKASERHPIAAKYDKFDEAFYLWLVTYINTINDINQIKGAPVWKIQYPGRISGITKNEGDVLSALDIINLAEQRNAQQRASIIKSEFESSCKGVLTSEHADFSYGYDDWRGFYVKVKEPDSTAEEFFDIGGHPLLESILDAIALCPGFSLSDDLAGVHEVRDPTGAFKNSHKRIDNDPEKANRCLAIEYLIAKGIISRNLKLPLALLIDACF